MWQTLLVRPRPRRDPGSREDQLRVERGLGWARLFLAATALIAVYLDPNEPSLAPGFTYSLIAVYLVFGVALAVSGTVSPARLLGSRRVAHVVDVGSAVALTLLTQGASSPFFVFFVFVVLAAASRWGVVETLTTGAVVVVVFVVEALVASAAPGLLGDVDPLRFLMRAAYLLVLTPIIGGLAAQQQARRAELGLLSRSLAGIKSSRTFTDALRAVADEGRAFFSAGDVAFIAERAHDGSRRVWRFPPDEHGGSPGGPWAQDLPPCPHRSGVLAWQVSRRDDGRVVSRAVTLDAEGIERVGPLDGTGCVPTLDALAARSVVVVPAGIGDDREEWTGGVLLIDPPRLADADLRFLASLARDLAPALHNAWLVQRLRSRVRSVERTRVGRALHDTVVQSLIGLEMEVEAMRRREDVPGRAERLGAIRDELRRDVGEVRDLMARLRPPTADASGFLDELTAMVARFGRETGIEARFECQRAAPFDCPAAVCRELVAIVQEALANVRRHSGARHVTVRATVDGPACRVVIEDDGRGFAFEGRMPHEKAMASAATPRLIRERVADIGGRLAIWSGPGRGARVEVLWSRQEWREQQEASGY